MLAFRIVNLLVSSMKTFTSVNWIYLFFNSVQFAHSVHNNNDSVAMLLFVSQLDSEKAAHDGK